MLLATNGARAQQKSELDAAFLANNGRPHECWDRYFARPRDFTIESARFASAAPRREPWADSELFSLDERRSLPLYSELLRPSGIGAMLVCPLFFRGRQIGFIYLLRGLDGRSFDSGESRQAAPMLPLLAAAEWAARSGRAVALAEALSPRELQVASLIAQGLQSKEIARAVGTSPHTVRKQTQHIFAKLHVHTRTEVAVLIQGGELP
jgi:DNA-binding CsgD family transcriptional regulator